MTTSRLWGWAQALVVAAGRGLERPLPLHSNHQQTMGKRNWVTDSYLSDSNRPGRYEATPDCWRELEASLQRWGGVSSWKRLEQLGAIAKTD